MLKLFLTTVVIFSLLVSCGTTSRQDYSGHGVESISSDVLKKFSPPILPVEQLGRIQSMLDIRTPSLGTLSPDGKTLFVNWDVTGSSQIWKIPGPGQFPIQLTGGQDATKVMSVLPNGKNLIVSRDLQGEEYPGLYLLSVEGGPLKKIYHERKVQALYEFVTSDSRYLFFRANDEHPSSYTIYKFDLLNNLTEKVVSLEGYWAIADYLDDGERLLLVKWKGNTSSEFYDYHVGSQHLTSLFGQNEKQEYRAQWGRGKNELIVLTNKFRDFRTLYRWRKGKFTPLTPEWEYDVDDFYLDRTKEKILLAVNKNGLSQIAVLNARNFRPLVVPKVKRDVLHSYFGMTTRNGRFSALGLESAKAPRINYIYDWKEKKLQQWVYASAPEIDTSAFVEENLEFYPARDGTLIPMFVLRPPECLKLLCPVIVNFHGGPEGQSRPGFSPSLQLLAEKGFVHVAPNVRGSDGYGKKWLDADNGVKRLDVISDVEDCAHYIKKNWGREGVSPKVGIMGGSYGGYLTLLGLSMFAGSYDAGVAIVGMSNLKTFLQNTAPYRKELRISEYGDPDRDREFLEKLSPITYVDQLKAPLLILQGATDPRVPAGEAVQLYEKLKVKQGHAELVLFPDEGHGIRKRENRARMLGYMSLFFERWLK